MAVGVVGPSCEAEAGDGYEGTFVAWRGEGAGGIGDEIAAAVFAEDDEDLIGGSLGVGDVGVNDEAIGVVEVEWAGVAELDEEVCIDVGPGQGGECLPGRGGGLGVNGVWGELCEDEFAVGRGGLGGRELSEGEIGQLGGSDGESAWWQW